MLVAILALLVALTGCGGDDSSAAPAENSSEAGIPSSPPKIEVPEGLPPKKLVVKDLAVGTGKEAHKGNEVALQYYCIIWENGGQYANSWRYSGAPVFVLGKHLLFRGLNMAVPGMKEGGGREVITPHNLIYYPERFHPPAGRLSALICKVYLVKVFGKEGAGPLAEQQAGRSNR